MYSLESLTTIIIPHKMAFGHENLYMSKFCGFITYRQWEMYMAFERIFSTIMIVIDIPWCIFSSHD